MKTSIQFFFIPFFICYLSSSLIAQSTISGQVQDAQGEAIDFANILLLNATDSSFVRGAVTDENGYYKCEKIAAGSYLIKASMLGFNDVYTSSFSVSANKNHTVEVIQLEEGVNLSEVEVVSNKPPYVQEIDRLVINVENTIVFGGSTAL